MYYETKSALLPHPPTGASAAQIREALARFRDAESDARIADVLYRRYGEPGPLSHQEIADSLRISRERARQLTARGLEILREDGCADLLVEQGALKRGDRLWLALWGRRP